MSTLQITAWDTGIGFSWRLTGLGGTWDTAHYTEIGITTEEFTTSGAASIDASQIVSYVTPTVSAGTSYVTPTKDVLYDAGTYTFYSYALVPNGKYYPGGSATVTITPSYTRDSIGTWSGTSKSASVGAYKILTYKYTAEEDGTLTWYSSTTGVDTIGWINDVSSFSVDDNGYPTSSNYYIGAYEDDASGSAFSATTEVVAGTTYYLFVTCYGGDSGTVTLKVSFTASVVAVDPWDWTISNGSATAAQTKAAYTAITSKGKTTAFNYLVWNDLVNKCNEVITARGGSWVTTYGTLAQALMTATDKVMTASRFNSVWWQCSQYINTGMGAASNGYCPVSRGDAMMGSYFIDLANAVNNTIWTG